VSTVGPTIAIADYGIGNFGSLANALEHLGASIVVTSQSQQLLEADGLILPGNGAFDASKQAMDKLSIPRWIGQRVAGGRPVLGIRVGHQIFFDSSEEFGIHGGMGEWPGVIKKLPTPAVPHLGWSQVRAAEHSTLFRGLEDERFYFAHSYAVLEWEFDQSIEAMFPPQVSWAHNGRCSVAALENTQLSGVLIPPDLSSRAVLKLVANWILKL